MEAVDAVVSAIEKFGNMKPPKYDLAAKQVKETMDKRYAPNWCCIIGSLECHPRCLQSCLVCTHLPVHFYLIPTTTARPSSSGPCACWPSNSQFTLCMPCTSYPLIMRVVCRGVFRRRRGARKADTALYVLCWQSCRVTVQKSFLSRIFVQKG